MIALVEKYDEKNARAHIKRVKDILGTPQLLSSTPSTAGVASVGTQLVQNAPGADDSVVEESKEELPAAQQQYEEKLKKNYEEFMAVVE